MEIKRDRNKKVTFNFPINEHQIKEFECTEQDVYEIIGAFYSTNINNEASFVAFKQAGAILHPDAFKKYLKTFH